MIYKVKMTVEAENDLDTLYSYIAFELRSPQIAAKQLARLKNMIQSLDEMPFRFRKYPISNSNAKDIHIVTVNKYCIFYVPNESTKEVTILRVIYGARNLPALLSDDK
jgi:toxin ParE1/3/4